MAASLLLLLGRERSPAARSFGALSLVLALAGYVTEVIWWNDGCWDAGIPCEGMAIEWLTTWVGVAAIAAGLICLVWRIQIWMRSRRRRLA